MSLQRTVEDLSQIIGRAAILEDHNLQLLAHSAHSPQGGPVDAVRSASIVGRNASGHVAEWLASLDLARNHGPVRVPANPELGMLPRLCIPIRHGDTLVGYLWFIDPDGSIDDAQISHCQWEIRSLGRTMYQHNVAHLQASSWLKESLQVLLSDRPERVEAARALEADGYLEADQGIVVIVVEPQPHTDERAEQHDVTASLAALMASAQRSLRRGYALHLVRRSHVVMVASVTGADREPAAALESVQAAVRQASAAGELPGRVLIGVGGAREDLADAASSYAEARMAVDIGLSRPGHEQVFHWSQLGVDRFIMSIAPLAEQLPPVHAGLEALLGDRDAMPLLQTLECYLDAAGNAQHTAEQLNLHRTSLYYRLQRIEALAGADLKNGNDRLALHLALKVARATGRYQPWRHLHSGATRERVARAHG